ncbi:MAG TPA: LysR family transcriptional regulator, partial [Burkholderiales bacterium]|nr:LysR family transcriptional regulator [Burkholderiales bacterium]
MHQVRYFLALTEHGSFARAAEACQVSQPALTTGIQRLEREMGGPLFHREGKRLVLSRLGQMVRPHIEQLHGESETATAIARNFRLLKAAPLAIGIMPSIGPGRIAGFLDAFRRQHPSVELAMSVAPLPALAKSLEKGEIDLALLSAPGGLPETLRGERVYDERYMVVFPVGHRFERCAGLTLQDVGGEAYVDRLACELRETVMAVCAERRVDLYANYRSEREDWIEA